MNDLALSDEENVVGRGDPSANVSTETDGQKVAAQKAAEKKRPKTAAELKAEPEQSKVAASVPPKAAAKKTAPGKTVEAKATQAVTPKKAAAAKKQAAAQKASTLTQPEAVQAIEPAAGKQPKASAKKVTAKKAVARAKQIREERGAGSAKKTTGPKAEAPVAQSAQSQTDIPTSSQLQDTASGAAITGAGQAIPGQPAEVASKVAETKAEPQPPQNHQVQDETALLTLAVASPAVAATQAALRKITFQIRYHTVIGESLYVSGNHPLFGNNDPDRAFPLSYLNEDHWFGTMDISAEDPLTSDITYNYVLKNTDGSVSVDWGTDKVIIAKAVNSEELLLIDSWNPSSLIENTFYTEPFQEVFLKENFTEVQTTRPEKVTHIFRAKAPLLAKGQALCIIGSIPELGTWTTESPLLLSRKQGEVWHSISLDLSGADFPFNYKYGLFDVNTKKFIEYETGSNRVIYDGAGEKLTVVSDGFASIPNNGFRGSGVAIPVFSLRSAKSFGVGEFTDMKLMVDWAKKVGLKLLQILPVNDTTATHSYTDSYPYAAISAFALHPLYLHLPLIIEDENSHVSTELQDKQVELNSKPAVDYVEVMREKWIFIKKVFPSQKQAVFNSTGFNTFFNENAYWLVSYAAFSYFREQNNTADFNQWQTNKKYNAEEINLLAGSPLDTVDEISIYYFVQYHLHRQLCDAASYAHENGIIVKGDIPIGIYRNSCDAWQQPELFFMDMQAGAPPDDFAVRGQNWGFPTYNWHRMREDGFSWWKKRFTQMSHYFDAFRIDHILGFFRIWSIPMDAVEGILGHFVPAVPVHINEIAARGVTFYYDRFCKPYITDDVLRQIFGNGLQAFIWDFIDSTADGAYALKPDFDNQRKVDNYFAGKEDSAQNRQIKAGLFDLISNVILLEVEGSAQQQFHFRIAMYDTLSYKHLDGYSKHHLYELYVNYFFRRQDDFWRKEAMLKLPELKRSTNMLICGEDLGMVPASVPGVMKDLAILSLEIQRMPKDPTREFFHPNDAPYLSVVTPSTHDMSTIRGWWEEDRGVTQRFFNNELGQWGTAPYFCEPWINKIIVLQHLYSPAMWSIFQLQDLLGISATLRRENPNEERINIPADPKHYWRYRMHLPLEQLINEDDFISEIREQVVKSGR